MVHRAPSRLRRNLSCAAVAVVAGGVLAALVACSDDAAPSAATPAALDSGIGPPPVASDPVLRGRWERLFGGLDFDFPNSDPRLDAREGVAHFVYRSKTGQLRYFLFEGPPGAVVRSEVGFPQGTKMPGRVVVMPSGESVVFGMELFNGQVSSFRRAPGSAAAVAGPPLDPARGRVPVNFESAELDGAGVFAGVVVNGGADAGSGPVVAVDRLGSAGWEALGEFRAGYTVARIRLASQSGTLALAIYEGTSVRRVHVYQRGAWRELDGLPPSEGVVGVPSLVVDGARVFLLEYQESSSTAVVWVHDGTRWSSFVRGAPGDGLRSLVLHGGALYALYGDIPNKGLPVTRGIARLDADTITRVAFDGQPADGNIDPDSRHDVMSQEECRLVSRGGALFLTYAEGSTSTQTIRLYRHVPR